MAEIEVHFVAADLQWADDLRGDPVTLAGDGLRFSIGALVAVRHVGELAERLRVGGRGQIGQRDGAAPQIDAAGPPARRAIADQAEVGVELGGEGAVDERELARMGAELDARRLHAVDARGAGGVQRAVAGLDVEVSVAWPDDVRSSSTPLR